MYPLAWLIQFVAWALVIVPPLKAALNNASLIVWASASRPGSKPPRSETKVL